jgi:O-methyltransferase involved in polyketide biosynthesis
MSLPEKYEPDTTSTDPAFWKRVVHFENRYWSIDQLLLSVPVTNMLELSSGFSLRGLATVKEKEVEYIDTDLDDVINQKKELLKQLPGAGGICKGSLRLLSLNALDESRFNELVSLFPHGPLAIVNEGLLMYLSKPEKERLCGIIYKILKQRGGFWVTGDIYVKSTLERFQDQSEDHLKLLVEQQRIEDNMFESFAEAETFFKNNGFEIDQEAVMDLSKISSLKYLLANVTETQLKEMQTLPNIQRSWRLKIKIDSDI